MSQNFFQSGPQLGNQFDDDALLRELLRAELPQEFHGRAEAELRRLGARAVSDLWAMAEDAERESPVHIPYDAWGQRIDEIRTSSAWGQLSDAAAEEGIVATGYERAYGSASRLVQFAKLYLYHPSSSFFSCPLAMTDGAARAIELYGDEELKRTAFRRLISRDPAEFWTSGQWMTERTGGSDVSNTSTVATPLGGTRYALTGTKWFTSATNSQMAMTLARIEGHPEGSRGLSLFYLELRGDDNRLRNIEVHRLKNKLGTHALPTAELSLKGTPARLVGGEGGGVKKISSLFNITRLYNAFCSLGATRRVLALSLDYARRRTAFGQPISRAPLHAETMADLVTEFEGNFHFTFYLAGLLGREETGEGTPEESAVLRLLTPVAKLYTAKSCVAITSEVIESFGGAGYIEDTGLPRWLRDAQVFPIWEGTTNVLSLDVLRAMEKEEALAPFFESIFGRLDFLPAGFAAEAEQVRDAVGAFSESLEAVVGEGGASVQASARRIAYSLARITGASLLLERAARDRSARSLNVARRWIRGGLNFPLINRKEQLAENAEICGF